MNFRSICEKKWTLRIQIKPKYKYPDQSGNKLKQKQEDKVNNKSNEKKRFDKLESKSNRFWRLIECAEMNVACERAN